MLFIDFEKGGRVKVNGRVSILGGQADLESFRKYPGYSEAVRVIRVDIEYAVINCPRYLDRAVSGAEK